MCLVVAAVVPLPKEHDEMVNLKSLVTKLSSDQVSRLSKAGKLEAQRKKFEREEKNLTRRLEAATKKREIAEAKIDEILGKKAAKRKHRKKRTMSATGRKSIAAAQRKRWAKFKAQKKSKE